MRWAIVLMGLALSACGAARMVEPPKGETLPPAPYGASRQPTPTERLTPTTQQRPLRSDELLKNSDKRTSDEFDLPPQ